MDSSSDLRQAPSAKRQRTLAGAPAPAPTLPSTSKRKEKMEADPSGDPPAPAAAKLEEDERNETCGICLTEGGHIRGRIDSCDHYFCFICIMEWAKIESLCPLCKRRFSSIRRPRVDGVFHAERVVEVPVRNQAYHPLGNESTRLSDPYAEVNCSICNGPANEELILLCDLCDMGAHTYCVGLGATVPEGDWYCPDCVISREEHSKSLLDPDSFHQIPCESIGAVRISEQPVSIFDIVSAETTAESSRRFSTTTIPGPQGRDVRLPFRSASHMESQESTMLTELASPLPPIAGPVSSNRLVERGARTLHNCRNVHDRICSLRQNWNALRAGSVAFSSNSLGPSTKISINQEPICAKTADISRQPTPSCYVKSKQTANFGANSKTSSIGDSRDISKAWKMMEKAKTVHRYHTTKICDDSVNFPGKTNFLMTVESNHSSFVASSGKNSVCDETIRNASEENKEIVTPRIHHRCNLQKELKQTIGTLVEKSVQNFDPSPNKSLTKLSSSRDDSFLLKQDTCTRKTKLALQEVVCQTSFLSDVQITKIGPGSSDYSASSSSALPSKKLMGCSSPKVEEEPHARKQLSGGNTEEISKGKKNKVENSSRDMVESSGDTNLNLCKKQHRVNSKHSSSTYCSDSLTSKNGTAGNSPKSEIQSLVTLNLRLLDRDRCLGAEGHKKVARIATHTILAACGLEHSRSKACSFPSPMCKHNEQIKQLRRSKLMPNSCRECFYTFVQDVVSSVMSEENSLSKC